MGIQFASVVISRHVDEGLVNETGNLNVVGRLDELHALKGSAGMRRVPWPGLVHQATFDRELLSPCLTDILALHAANPFEQ